jgi:hypothetical protein
MISRDIRSGVVGFRIVSATLSGPMNTAVSGSQHARYECHSVEASVYERLTQVQHVPQLRLPLAAAEITDASCKALQRHDPLAPS